MIDLAQLRREPDLVKSALARRGVLSSTMDEIEALDVEHRRLLQEAEALRAQVKELSRQVGDARRTGDAATANELTEKSRQLGDDERAASEVTDAVASKLHSMLLMIPNVPDSRVP